MQSVSITLVFVACCNWNLQLQKKTKAQIKITLKYTTYIYIYTNIFKQNVYEMHFLVCRSCLLFSCLGYYKSTAKSHPQETSMDSHNYIILIPYCLIFFLAFTTFLLNLRKWNKWVQFCFMYNIGLWHEESTGMIKTRLLLFFYLPGKRNIRKVMEMR